MSDCNDNTKLAVITERMDKAEETIKELVKDVSNLEKKSAVDSERLSNFSTSISKIEQGVDKISRRLDENDKRPMTIRDKAIAAILGGVIVYVLTAILQQVIVSN